MQPSGQHLPWRTEAYKLTHKQKKFIRQWFESFATDQPQRFPPSETINALATLVQASQQTVLDYINKKYITPETTVASSRLQDPESHPLADDRQRKDTFAGYTVKDANRHLAPATLQLVEKYVAACQRRRAQIDGRRSVNAGPFRCTFGCGYQTKRAFDWRRHEETHEPQELWLCLLCYQNNHEQNPFLVNRKDKFLKHAKEAHKGWEAETVLDMSKVDFHANFNPQCPLCPEVSQSWDERCRHILGHYEDEMQNGLGRTSRQPKSSDIGSSSDEDRKGFRVQPSSSDFQNEANDHATSLNSILASRNSTGPARGVQGATRRPSQQQISTSTEAEGVPSGISTFGSSTDSAYPSPFRARLSTHRIAPAKGGSEPAIHSPSDEHEPPTQH